MDSDQPEVERIAFQAKGVLARDIHAERDVLSRLLSTLADDGREAAEQLFSTSQVTPWIAKQLGCHAEKEQAQGNIQIALDLAVLAVNAGLLCGDNAVYGGNVLTLSALCSQLGLIDLSERVLEGFLTTPSVDGVFERGLAHLTLASLKATRASVDAARHLELAFRILEGRLPDSEQAKMQKLTTQVYYHTRGFAGLMHVNSDSGKKEPFALETGMDWKAESLDNVVAWTTTLNLLGNQRLATRLQELFLKSKEKIPT